MCYQIQTDILLPIPVEIWSSSEKNLASEFNTGYFNLEDMKEFHMNRQRKRKWATGRDKTARNMELPTRKGLRQKLPNWFVYTVKSAITVTAKWCLYSYIASFHIRPLNCYSHPQLLISILWDDLRSPYQGRAMKTSTSCCMKATESNM